MPAGDHNIIFNARNLASGIYYYRIQIGNSAKGTQNFQDVKKMILLK